MAILGARDHDVGNYCSKCPAEAQRDGLGRPLLPGAPSKGLPGRRGRDLNEAAGQEDLD